MGSFVFIGLLAPALFLLLIAWAISTIVIALTLPKKAAKAPACERCKYPVAGLAAFNCPECGTDLRLTGIITRPMEVRRRGNLFSAIMAWTVLCAMVALVATSLFGSFWMMSTLRSSGNTSTMTTKTTLTPASQSSKGIDIVTTVVTPISSASTPKTTLTATIRTASGQTFIAKSSLGSAPTPASNPTWTWKRDDGSDASASTLDAAAVLEWYALAGIEKTPASESEAADLAQSLSTIAANPYATGIASNSLFQANIGPTVMSGFGATNFGTNDAYFWTALSLALVGLLAWGVGIWLIVNRRKRMLRAAA